MSSIERSVQPQVISDGEKAATEQGDKLASRSSANPDHDISANGEGNETVRRIPAVDKLSPALWVFALAGALERFAYYTLSAPLQNYIQNDRHGGANPGALGLGQQTATNITNVFFLLQCITPLPFAALADMRFGRLKTLMISLVIYQCGGIILVITSLPISLDHGAGLPGLIAAMVLIALGVAGLKATLPPLLVDQYSRTEPRLLKTRGNNVFESNRTLTIQFITNMFFWVTNIASLAAFLGATWIEKKVDFWAAYLMAFLSLFVSQTLIFFWRKRFVTSEIQGSVLPLASKALWCAVRHGFSLNAASPEHQLEKYGRTVPWDSAALEDIQRALVVSRVLLFSFPFYLTVIQVTNNLISQAGQMRLDGMPNDMMQVFNPAAITLLAPVIQQGLFTVLRRMHISFRPVARISVACFITGISMAYAAGVQQLIYSHSPCFTHPLSCAAAHEGKVILGNNVAVWLQIPVWVIIATGEILGFATIAEIAYEMAPKSMKSLVQAVTQFTAGLAAVVGIALSPLTRDPNLVILYSVIAGLTVLTSGLFWLFFRSMDRVVERVEETT